MIFEKLFGRKKIGIALSGGAARGMAHIGVLKVLEENHIPLDFMAATSSGAIVAAVYAAGIKIAEMLRIIKELGWGDLARIDMVKTGLISSKAIEEFLVGTIGDKKFEDLILPLAVVASDIKTGEKVVLREGSVALAVRASCSFPGIYTPVTIDDRVLVDGGVVENLPVPTLKEMGANYLIAVDCIPKIVLKTAPKNIIDVIDRAVDIILKSNSQKVYPLADCVIEPVLENITSLEIDEKLKLIELGEIAAATKISKIKWQL